MLTGNRKSPPIKKYIPAVPEQKVLFLINMCEASHFLIDLSNVFGKKSGGFLRNIDLKAV